jgi:hypothetical protein
MKGTTVEAKYTIRDLAKERASTGKPRASGR